MVDDFHPNHCRRRLGERPARCAEQRRPSGLINLRSERLPEPLTRVIPSQEVGVADEEALFVVMRIDEPTGDIVNRVQLVA
jgi:hypothetical protein